MVARARRAEKQEEASWHPNEGQIKAIDLLGNGQQRHTCLVGGSRSGKTFIFLYAILIRAQLAEHSRHIVLRKHGNAARTAIALDTLPKVVRLCFPELKLVEKTNPDYYFLLPNGAEIWIGGLDDKDRVEKILGKEYSTILFNECSEIAYQNVLTALTRLAQVCKKTDGSPLQQRAYYDLNPTGKGHWTNVLFGDKRDLATRQPLEDPNDYQRLFLNPMQNQANLTPEYLKSLSRMPSKQRQRFFEGRYVDEAVGALWSFEIIDGCRIDVDPHEQARKCDRVVVAVDPSGAKSENDLGRDEIGIIVAGRGLDGHMYVLADYSLRDHPSIWGRRVIQAYDDFEADAVVVEDNFGGEMVRNTIRGTRKVRVKSVTASRGKAVRAQPVSSLYVGDKDTAEGGRVHHCGRFPVLEEQMVGFTEAGYIGEGSPDHVDALVWCGHELMVEEIKGQGIFDYYRLEAEKAGYDVRGMDQLIEQDLELLKPPKLKVGWEFSDPGNAVAKQEKVKLRVPRNTSMVVGQSGAPYRPGRDGMIEASAEDAQGLLQQGFQKVV
jgi:Terminase large subunit, T4likevirus-type, N-terminal/Terminase RNaseH-like domain